MDDGWARQRRTAIGVRANLANHAAARDAERAQLLINAFVQQALADGPPPVAIRAISTSGTSLRTDLCGWYIKADRSIAVGTDGGYYQLIVFANLKDRLLGVHLLPSPPPLVVGRGGKDGESGDLQDFLARALRPE